jgi:hypothetical protein
MFADDGVGILAHQVRIHILVCGFNLPSASPPGLIGYALFKAVR